MVLYWAFVLAIAMLLYVLLDGFDLGRHSIRPDPRGDAAARHVERCIHDLGWQ